ncbi:unknown [Bacteroides sp. CAG:598]|nr:unknown [Bacteroides sp. CAG:598]
MTNHATQSLFIFLLAGPTERNQRLHHSHHHGIQHIRIVIVHAELASVAVPAVTHVPFLYFVLRHTQAELVGLLALLHQKSLGQTGKEQPVVIGTCTVAQCLERLNITLFGHLVQWFPQSLRGTQESMYQISCIHDRLSLLRKVQFVGRIGIHRILQSFQHFLLHLLTQFSFLCIVVGQSQPGSHTGQRTPHSFQMRNFIIPGRVSTYRLYRHILMQSTFCQIMDDGIRNLPQPLHPLLTVLGTGSLFSHHILIFFPFGLHGECWHQHCRYQQQNPIIQFFHCHFL